MKSQILSAITITTLLLITIIVFVKKHNLKDYDKKEYITNQQSK